MFLDRLLLYFPIRVVFPAFILLVFGVAGLYSGYFEVKDLFSRLKKEKLEYVCKTASDFQEMAEFLAWKNSLEIVERKLINISADPYVDVVFVSNPSGKIVLSSKRKYIGKDYRKVLKKELPLSYKKVSSVVRSFYQKAGIFCSAIENEGKIVAVSPILFYEKGLRNASIGFFYMQYNLIGIEKQSKKWVILKLTKLYGILLFLFVLIYTGFNKLIGERINTIVQATKKIAKGNIDIRIKLKGRDEFSLIASVINDLVDRLSRYISYDYLTGILNRFGLEKEIKKALKRHPDLWNVFILIDLDNFKDVNDTFGHDVGDKLLKKFARRLKEVATGKTVGRLGGDEFVVFFQTEEKIEIENMLKLWMKELTAGIVLGERVFEVSFTCGVSIKKEDSTFYQLLKESDIALYYGKKKGKRLFIIFNDEIRIKEERRIKLTEVLKNSLEKREFYIVYQPIVELNTGKIFSIEALLRMKNEEIGEVSPAEFIPVLEETGMIKDVGYWVIKEVAKDIKEFQQKNVNINASINVDIQQLLDKDFVKTVKSIIEETGISPRNLKFEITESEAMKFPELTISVLKELSSMGLQISIDDFGTGYSSLSYLKMMPVSYIKIDRSFVSNIPSSREDNILVMTIVNLAKSFGFKTIAEGVEEKIQLLFLQEIGCDYVQGYFFSRPVSKQEILVMLKESKKFQA
ncbi:EAL domain-containing protein [Persephonella atlantica]|uniref:EAL domain-containing protein n=1 Tax=Persephonella atlantica TaxID=2699429 RepID=A0ABS1GHM3_9AQUI|nr:GGDEF domain-containing protein [Persephonella atlantica]MBK3332247.1 EAL domain-containing protein [Persephonella atlantica]